MTSRQREIARVVVLVVASFLLLATSVEERPPMDRVGLGDGMDHTAGSVPATAVAADR